MTTPRKSVGRTDRTERIEIRCTAKEKDLLQRAARLESLETSAWVRSEALYHAREILGEPK